MVLMRALRDMNLPKFVFEDVPLFLGLIGDLFPGLDCPRVRYPKFNDAVEAVLMDNKYILLPHQVRMCVCVRAYACVYVCVCMCVCVGGGITSKWASHFYYSSSFFFSLFSSPQADKVVQLYETMLTRHTTMVVGPTGGGKSVVINTLAQAQTRLVIISCNIKQKTLECKEYWIGYW